MAQSGNGDARHGRLKSWKEIAAFFGTDERTVKRWEGKRGLPVRRIPGGARATVYAEVIELERWLDGAKAPAARGAANRRTWAFAAAGALLLAAAAGLGLSRHAPAAAAHHEPTQAVADLYFAGQYNLERRTPESLNRAVQLFRQAIARDPRYAAAYAGLADCQLLLREYADVPDAVAYPRARAAAERALALDERLADAHAALAFVTLYWDRDFDAGLASFRRAIALDPGNAGPHHWYATALYHAGRVPAALEQIDQAQRLEPESQAILSDKALILSAAGRTGEAIALLRQMEAADPDYLSPHSYLAAIDLTRGDYPAYLAEERTAARLIGDADRASIEQAAERGFAVGGAPAMFRAMLGRQRQLYAAGQGNAYALAETYALMGDKAAAMTALALAVRNREPDVVGLRIDMRLTSLHDLPEFRRLAAGVGGA
jgi:tetratricopeptide (TPR) repeat protein